MISSVHPVLTESQRLRTESEQLRAQARLLCQGIQAMREDIMMERLGSAEARARRRDTRNAPPK